MIGVRRVGPAHLDLFIVLREIGGDPRVWSLPCPPIPSRYAQRPTASLDEYSSQCSVRGVTDAGRVIVIHVLSCSACPRTPALFVRARVRIARVSLSIALYDVCTACILYTRRYRSGLKKIECIANQLCMQAIGVNVSDSYHTIGDRATAWAASTRRTDSCPASPDIHPPPPDLETGWQAIETCR